MKFIITVTWHLFESPQSELEIIKFSRVFFSLIKNTSNFGLIKSGICSCNFVKFSHVQFLPDLILNAIFFIQKRLICFHNIFCSCVIYTEEYPYMLCIFKFFAYGNIFSKTRTNRSWLSDIPTLKFSATQMQVRVITLSYKS